MTWQELPAAHQQAAAALTDLRGSLRRARPVTIDRDSQRRFATLLADNETAQRFPQEHARIQGEMRRETEAERRLAAGHARHVARQVRTLKIPSPQGRAGSIPAPGTRRQHHNGRGDTGTPQNRTVALRMTD